jgi:hypothetical protein
LAPSRSTLAADDLRLELPFSPSVLASLVANVFQGIEVEVLAGVSEREAPHREALEALGELIVKAEAHAAPA